MLPCRPTISCTADLVPPGSFEIEAGYYARRVPPAGYVHDQPLLAKLTLFPWIQAQLGMNGAVFTTGRQSPEPPVRTDLIAVAPTPYVVEGAHTLKFTVVKDTGYSLR